MPRTARAIEAGLIYHVFNRGNGRARVFHRPEDYDAFVGLLAEAAERTRGRVLAYCLMPNHFHLVLWPRTATVRREPRQRVYVGRWGPTLPSPRRQRPKP